MRPVERRRQFFTWLHVLCMQGFLQQKSYDVSASQEIFSICIECLSLCVQTRSKQQKSHPTDTIIVCGVIVCSKGNVLASYFTNEDSR